LIINLVKFIYSGESYPKTCNTFYMHIRKFSTLLTFLILISGCAIVTDEYQANQRKVIAYLLEDLPLPEDAEIVKAPTVLLGTGEAISGRIILTSGYSPAENLIFYGTETLTTGWQLISSKVGEEVTLVYSKSGRFATIYISPRDTFTGFFSGDSGSDIDISVVHPDAISIQNPYQDLDYEKLPDSP
tara:strand:+ start:460 stop:1020 length:561 start_codon:yes stop_codon:yes gene_type:complete